MENNEYYEKSISELKEHAKTANLEMGEIKECISSIKTDIAWLKNVFDKLDTKIWSILVTIILGTLIQIILKLWK